MYTEKVLNVIIKGGKWLQIDAKASKYNFFFFLKHSFLGLKENCCLARQLNQIE